MKPAIVVHGGCGTVPAAEESPRQAACQKAANTGLELLQRGAPALQACEAAIEVLEDSGILNAGIGAYRQADGMARRDASVMTSDGHAGAVAQVPFLRNPIRLAAYLLRQDAYVMLCGSEAFQLGLRLGHPCSFTATEAKNTYWREHLSEACLTLDYEAMAQEWKQSNPRLGTVGCVCLDQEGRLAAGTSTGGTGQAYPGRVGDTPIIGAGTYCTPQVGVSMTGVGERILVLLSAKSFCDNFKRGQSLEEAGGAVLEDLRQFSNGAAGLIALDAAGRIVAQKNTPFMAWAKAFG